MRLKRAWGGQRQTGTGIWNLQRHIFISWAAPLSCPSMLCMCAFRGGEQSVQSGTLVFVKESSPPPPVGYY